MQREGEQRGWRSNKPSLVHETPLSVHLGPGVYNISNKRVRRMPQLKTPVPRSIANIRQHRRAECTRANVHPHPGSETPSENSLQPKRVHSTPCFHAIIPASNLSHTNLSQPEQIQQADEEALQLRRPVVDSQGRLVRPGQSSGSDLFDLGVLVVAQFQTNGVEYILDRRNCPPCCLPPPPPLPVPSERTPSGSSTPTNSLVIDRGKHPSMPPAETPSRTGRSQRASGGPTLSGNRFTQGKVSTTNNSNGPRGHPGVLRSQRRLDDNRKTSLSGHETPAERSERPGSHTNKERGESDGDSTLDPPQLPTAHGETGAQSDVDWEERRDWTLAAEVEAEGWEWGRSLLENPKSISDELISPNLHREMSSSETSILAPRVHRLGKYGGDRHYSDIASRAGCPFHGHNPPHPHHARHRFHPHLFHRHHDPRCRLHRRPSPLPLQEPCDPLPSSFL